MQNSNNSRANFKQLGDHGSMLRLSHFAIFTLIVLVGVVERLFTYRLYYQVP